MHITTHYDGPDYRPRLDALRLKGQTKRIFNAMLDAFTHRRWMTLAEIAQVTGDPVTSISAQLRHLRKERFGSHVIEKQRRGNPEAGLFEYRMVPNLEYPQPDPLRVPVQEDSVDEATADETPLPNQMEEVSAD